MARLAPYTAPDRRTARTRRALHAALLRLVERKSYDVVTVGEIVAAADVGRSTFYMHFSCKDDLLRGGFESLRDELRALQDAALSELASDGTPRLAFSAALFAHACAHRPVYRALLGSRGSIVVLDELQRILTDLVRRDVGAAPALAAAPPEIVVAVVVAAFNAILRWGLVQKRGGSPDELDTAFRRLVLRGIVENPA